MQRLHTKLQIGTAPSKFPRESESVAISLDQVKWSSFWLYSCSEVFSAVTELTRGLLLSPDITFPRLRGSRLTQRRRPWLPGCGDQSACLPPAHQGHLMRGQSFISLISLTIKWVYVLVTPGSLPCKHPGRPCSKPWSLPYSRASFAGPAHQNLPWFAHSMCHTSLVKCLKWFFSLWLSRALSAGMNLTCKRCFIRVHWKNEWLVTTLCFSNLRRHWRTVKTQIVGSHLQNFCLSGSEVGLGLCISNKLSSRSCWSGDHTWKITDLR